MPTHTPELQPHHLLPVAAAMLALLVWGRVFTRHAFALAPDRRLGLSLLDAFVGLCFFYLGLHFYAGAAALLGVSPDGPPAVKIVAVILSQFCTGLPPVLYLVLRAASVPRGLQTTGLVPTRPGRDLLAGVGGFLVAMPLVFATLSAASHIAAWLGHPPDRMAHDLLPLVHDPRSSPRVLLLLFFSVAILAPILEEAIYRGLLQSSLVESLGGRRWPAILITALLFSAIHANVVDPPALAGLFVLAVAMGWLYERTGSLWPSILVHALFNAMNLGMAWLLIPPGPGAV